MQIHSQWDKLLTEWQGRVLKDIPQRVTSIPAHFHSGLTLNSRNKGLKRCLDGFPKPGVCYVIRLKEMKDIPKGPDCITLHLEHTYKKNPNSGFQLIAKLLSRSEPNKEPIWNQTGVLWDSNFLSATRKIVLCKWSPWKKKKIQQPPAPHCGKVQSNALWVKQHGKPPNTSPRERMLSCSSLSTGANRPQVTCAFFPFFFFYFK